MNHSTSLPTYSNIESNVEKRESLFSIFIIFLKFGLLAWGGPVAQIAMFKEELVDKRKWISPEKFRLIFGVYQSLPGPEAMELCVYFGMVRAGHMGGFLAGIAFILPGFLIILSLASIYVSYGANVLLPLFVGVTPVVPALIGRAAHRIGRDVLKKYSLWVACIISILLTMLGVHFIWIFVICSIWESLWMAGKKNIAIATLMIMSIGVVLITKSSVPMPEEYVSTASGGLLIEGLKAGLLTFGGAYTSIPFLQDSMVNVYPNISMQTFMDGVALCSVIPAPLVIIATYLGFMANGFIGAVLMTVGIFLPAFAFTLLGHKYLEKIIEHKALHGALEGITAGVIGLLVLTAVDIFKQAVTNWQQAAIFTISLIALYSFKKRWGVPVIVLSCGIAGYTMKSYGLM